MKGIKFDDCKVRPSLVFDDMKNALNEVIRVAEFGARKYAAGNWLLVDDGKQRYKEAKYRHAMAQLGGRDEESCLLHLAHEAWNCLALLELQLREEYALAESSRFQGDLFIPEQAAFKQGFDVSPEEEEAWREAEKRMDAIGQNGPTGEHYTPEWVSEVLDNHTLPTWAERLELTASGNVYVHGAGDKSARLCVLNKLALGMSHLAETWEVAK